MFHMPSLCPTRHCFITPERYIVMMRGEVGSHALCEHKGDISCLGSLARGERS